MSRIRISPDAPFSQAQLDRLGSPIQAVFAGRETVAVLRSDHSASFLTTNPDTQVRDKYWINMDQIALSQDYANMALGLQLDRECMIGKRFLRNYCADRNQPWYFDVLNQKIRDLRNIRRVAASDSFFALNEAGQILQLPLDPGAAYPTRDWPRIRDLWAGPNRVLGISEAGSLLLACVDGSAQVLCPSGVCLACGINIDPDGALYYTEDRRLVFWEQGKHRELPLPPADRVVKLAGCLNRFAVLTESGKLYLSGNHSFTRFRPEDGLQQIPGTFRDVALGAPADHFPVFWVALEEEAL